MRSIKFAIPFALLILVLPACNNEPSQASFEEEALNGRWEIDEAWRNGKQTETLTGTYYEFDENGNMRTNLTPSLVEDKFAYDLSGNEIRQKSDPPVVYTIQTLTDSLLVISMSINTFPFRLQLKKAGAAAENASEVNDTL